MAALAATHWGFARDTGVIVANPVAEEVARRHICLPVHSDMSDAEVDEVLTAIAAVHETLPGG